jgi:hypothetical protein
MIEIEARVLVVLGRAALALGHSSLWIAHRFIAASDALSSLAVRSSVRAVALLKRAQPAAETKSD